MFKEIFLFEIKFRLKRVSTYVYFALWLFMGFLLTSSDSISIGGTGTKILKNSSYLVSLSCSVLMALGMAVTSALTGMAVYRDFEQNTYALFFTAPIKKSTYLNARLLASLLLSIIVFSGVILGMMFGSFMPWVDQEKIMPFSLIGYLHPLFIIVIPNVFFAGALFFLVGTLSRSVIAVYLQSVVFFALYFISIILSRDIDNKFWPALFDPFAIRAISYVTKYWTISEQNSLLIPLSDMMLYNRLLWISLGIIAIFAVNYWFSFSSEAISLRRNKKLNEVVEQVGKVQLLLPKVTQSFSLSSKLEQFISLTKFNFLSIAKSLSFWALLLIGMFLVMLNGSLAGRLYGTPTYPVTYAVLELTSGSFILFFLIITTVYAGELVWKEREIKFDQIYDGFPLSNYITYFSRLLSLLFTHIILIIFLIISGIIIQTYNGYFNFEIGIYLRSYFGQTFPYLLQISVLSLLIHTLIKNKFAGHAAIILFYVSQIALAELGYQHNIYHYAGSVSVIYSDMNGFGHFVKPVFWFNFYWTSFAGLLAVISVLLLTRGTETSLKSQFSQARLLFNPKLNALLGIFLVSFLLTGSYIFYNTNILNKYSDEDRVEKQQVQYEKLYKKHQKIAQPRITATQVKMDLFPETRSFLAKATYTMLNKTDKDIDTIHLTFGEEEPKSLTFDRDSKAELIDKDLGYRIYKLATPLKPKEQLIMNFEIDYKSKGFRNNGEVNQLVANGTFFNNSQFFPSLGYNKDYELNDKSKRKKNGLGERPEPAPADNMEERMNNYISSDADWITFETTISTSPDQIAIAPGYLQKEWVENGRRYFEYKMGETKILNFFSFLSGRYEVKRDKWNDVNIEIYYHKTHPYNVDRMIESTKKGLEYFSKNFSPYQHKQFRIIEFPRYASFAQSFPNTIPYSEAIGFIAKIDEDDDIDFPFYVTAHELAHQWWAHQVISGDVQGSTLLSETLAQYSALMLLEKEYGKENIRKYLKYELDRYLRGRSSEDKKENPMSKVQNQPYIHYQKGSLVMYALKDYIGEEAVNNALKNFASEVAYKEPPYPSSIELIKHLKEVTPPDLQYLIEDLFENITLFENKALDATYTKTPDGKYLVKLKVQAKKLRANGDGEEKAIAINDLIDIGVFSGEKKKQKELHLQKYKVDKEEMTFEIKVDEVPSRAGIDPYNKLVDRNSDDNVKETKSSD
ncbi:MAG: hypothetical protein HY819_07800 [Acidobacteria bacterium]|nr:hypothetical protein [Acidobacteriota bacterium]